MYRKNTAGQFITFQLISTTDGSAITGVSPAVRRCIDGTFAAGGGTVTEDTAGFYKYAMSQADTNGNDIGFRFSGTGAITLALNIVTTAADPTDAVRLGLTALPNVASGSAGALLVDGTGTAAISNSSGKVLLQATQSGVTIPTVTTVTNQLTAAAIATGVWDALTSALTTAGSIGKYILDNLTAGGIAAIKAKTDSLTFTVANKVDANELAINGDATSAANLAKTTRAIGRGTCAALGTTTSVITSAFAPSGAAADQFKGRIITFDADTTTTALRGQSTDITASTNAATPTFTVTALTTAPVSGDTFSVT